MERCYECRFWRWGACSLIEGSIEADDVCDLYLPPVKTFPDEPEDSKKATSVYTAASDAGRWKLFVDQGDKLFEVPDWINVLPLPGKYSHPSYGEIVITPERNRRFVSNFNNQVYQQNLPITLDIEHDGKMSGAVGYFSELRINIDGSVDANVKWSERGRTMLSEDRFKYFSPEWWDSWQDPLTSTTYHDVLIGGAICTRPFFKEAALRPLVANEHGLAVPEGDKDPRKVLTLRQLAVAPKEKRKMEFTEADAKLFAELKERDTATQAQLVQMAEEKKQADERVAKLESEAQKKKFTDVVLGRDGSGDGAVFVGGVEENVNSLVRLAQVYGEDSDEFKAEVTLRKSSAKTLSESGAFKAVGSSLEAGVETDASSEIDKKVREAIAADSTLDQNKAMDKVFRENPGLYQQHRQASRFRESTS